MPGAKAAKTSSLYGVHPGAAMVQKWVSELKEKTERSLEEGIALLKKEGPKDEKSRRDWLKTKHKLGTNSAWWIAERADGKGGEEDTPGRYLKAALRPRQSCRCIASTYSRKSSQRRMLALL